MTFPPRWVGRTSDWAGILVRSKTGSRIRKRQTASAALQDIKAILRLIDLGEVRVSEKTRRPSLAAMKGITGVLADGDLYAEADQSKDDWEPVSDLRIQSFAWPTRAGRGPGGGGRHAPAVDGGRSQGDDQAGP